MTNPFNLHHPGVISGNLRIRTSNSWEKKCFQKNIWNFIWTWNIQKWLLQNKVVRLLVSLSSSQCVLLLHKNVFLFLELPFYFPEVPFCFLELPFCFPEVLFCFPEVPFYFSKMPYCFRELPFSFPEVPSIYLLCTSFSKKAFFAADCTFSSCSELIREIIFTLLLFCFLMKLFIDQVMVPSW